VTAKCRSWSCCSKGASLPDLKALFEENVGILDLSRLKIEAFRHDGHPNPNDHAPHCRGYPAIASDRTCIKWCAKLLEFSDTAQAERIGELIIIYSH